MPRALGHYGWWCHYLHLQWGRGAWGASTAPPRARGWAVPSARTSRWLESSRAWPSPPPTLPRLGLLTHPKHHPSLHRNWVTWQGLQAHPPPQAHPHSPLSPCGQPRHARQARRRLPIHEKAREGGRASVGRACPLRWGQGGEGRGYLRGHRALPRGRPRPALRLCPARKRRPVPAHRASAQDLLPASAPPAPGERSHLPVLPSRPWTLLVLGDPAGQRAEGSEPPHPRRPPPKGEGHWQLPWHGCASPTQGPTGEALFWEHPVAQSQGPLRGTGTHRQPVGTLLSWGTVATSVTLREIRG